MGVLKHIFLMGAALSISGSVMAQESYRLGTPATAKEIAGWHIDVLPDGDGSPVGSGTVLLGKQVYESKCIACHGADLKGVAPWPALVGGEGSLSTNKPIKTVGSYWPYATTLYDYIRRAMPFTEPQSLSNADVYSVTAYVLYMNGILDEDASLNEKSLPEVKMPNRDGFYVDDRPDTKNVRCMSDCLTQALQ